MSLEVLALLLHRDRSLLWQDQWEIVRHCDPAHMYVVDLEGSEQGCHANGIHIRFTQTVMRK
jgi:hypothetical protein